MHSYFTPSTLEIVLLIGVSLIHKIIRHTPHRSSLYLQSLDTYGAIVTQIKAPIGATVPLVDIEKALKERKYKVLTFTHVDTSTGMFPP